MGQVRMGPPANIILSLRDRLGIANFVETGTYHGDTAEWATLYFKNVFTIELSTKYYEAARARFARRAQVRVIDGSSLVALREVVDGLSAPAIFWLDAHWSGIDTAGKEAECPVLEEIAIIDSSRLGHVVVVDDARLFCAPPPSPHSIDHWPDLARVVAALGKTNQRYVVEFEDVFIAVPEANRGWFSEFLQDEVSALYRGPAKWWERFLR